MFKNITVYKIVQGGAATDLDGHAFLPCGASQEKSAGWVPPRGEAHGALIEHVAGQRIMKFMVESKVVPSAVVKRKVQEQLEEIERQTGRKPGKKERREIGEDARMALLPMAFSKMAAALVWIDPAAGLLVIDSTSRAMTDSVTTWLIKAFDGMVLQLVQTHLNPAVVMCQMLVGPSWASLTVDRECELKACDESKAVVKYGRHALDTDEVRAHIAAGKVPTRLALTWNDRVSFVLNDSMQLKKITFLESVFEGNKDSEADAFDADVTIATGELRKLIPDLIGVHGGEADELF